MDFRETVVDTALKSVRPRCAIEVGCMFTTNEGLSTLHIGRFIAASGGTFVSIEYDQNHIDAARMILGGEAAMVTFRCGHSLALLPDAISELGQVDFFLLDGGAHPEVCLHEFELAKAALSDRGLILVDDAQDIAPSEAYGLSRPSGKATLILPMLILGEYMEGRKDYLYANATKDDCDTTPNAKSLVAANGISPDGRAFKVLGGGHKMLAFGPPDIVNQLALLRPPKRSRRQRLSNWLRGR